MSDDASALVNLSSKKFLALCAGLTALVLFIGSTRPISPGFIAAELFLTIAALFIFGSIRYRIDKNALTYGAGVVIAASFATRWWPGASVSVEFIREHFLTLHGLEELVHADTMLFILGLTLFVCVIAQTRILESLSFAILRRYKGGVFPTVALLTAIVSAASGILDGVSMIGLLIRTMVIILFLAKSKEDDVIFAVVISTIVTTVCGMWLAYGEPPNLIMKANLHPHLTNVFFLRYCLPVAIGTYLIVWWNIRVHTRGSKVELAKLDILDVHTADVRFLQALRHGEVLTPVEFAEEHRIELGGHLEKIVHRLQKGEPFGEAMAHENVPADARRMLMGKFVSEEMAKILDEHYMDMVQGKQREIQQTSRLLEKGLEPIRLKRQYAARIGGLSFIPFIGFLIWHGMNHKMPLFLASFAGFAVAFMGIAGIPRMRKLALKEAVHEYKEYLFLFPLFLSITLLQKTGYFNVLADLLRAGIEKIGVSLVAYIQFAGAAFLSAMLDNNVVADFASRALHNLDVSLIHLFSMAQIAGYAAGGCWTHIGSAQSVVAYAFIQKEVNERYTPFQWMKMMTPIILEIFALMVLVIWTESWLLK